MLFCLGSDECFMVYSGFDERDLCTKLFVFCLFLFGYLGNNRMEKGGEGMTEGTKSYLIGCHQFLTHPFFVLIAWRLEYKSWPKWWELICIFLHDIGICKRQYLSNNEAKTDHWKAGAYWSLVIVEYLSRNPHSMKSLWAWKLAAGHCPRESTEPESKLFRPDKRARVIAPLWVMWIEWRAEMRKIGGATPPEWRKIVKEKLATGKTFHAHELHIKTRR